ncbi:MAG: cytochrome C biogenesis protein [Acidobacteria bacterium CG_4_9_14_3_um_filter_49_7]|nr:MAG: cytochrome C biogenesis protein [Acidobacteria bacterium CG_4_9_14_3_um_filter_49_7]
MTNTLLLAAGSAFWFGILTSISPCPLATNIAAVSYISQDVEKPGRVIFSGLLYTAGRVVTYTVLGTILVTGFLAVFDVASFLQQRMNHTLGILLFLTGLVLLGIIPLPTFSTGFTHRASEKLATMGFIGTFFLGTLLALSFCPVSAALFFGSLIPLAMRFQSHIFLPSMFGIGTAFPVLVFALAFGYGSHAVASAFNWVSIMEKWFRRITGAIFVAVGTYYIYLYILTPFFSPTI